MLAISAHRASAFDTLAAKRFKLWELRPTNHPFSGVIVSVLAKERAWSAAFLPLRINNFTYSV
jgi:hypothetical protein